MIEFPRDSWIRLWSGRWSVLFTSLYGEMYTSALRRLIGEKFDDIVMVCEEKSRSVFLREAELQRVCGSLAKEFESEKDAVDWSNRVIRETDSILALCAKMKARDDFSGADYETLVSATFSHIAPNFVIKKVSDYLPREKLDAFLPHFSRARAYTEPVYNEVDEVLKKIAAAAARKAGLSEEFSALLTHEDLRRYFKTGELPNAGELEKRANLFVISCSKGKYAYFVGGEAVEAKDAVAKTGAAGFVKGRTAFPGKARGVVRIIMNPLKAHRFNEGDVLVTGMTRPEFLGYMKKASAIVTDAGGVLCHAAIVARELKKPCVIGTENASKAFKDGDVVEVDADKGIVRKVG
jgi:phosphohistidine swiveling domain-containing protein